MHSGENNSLCCQNNSGNPIGAEDEKSSLVRRGRQQTRYVDIDSHRKYLVTTYGSGPVIVEAAAYLLNSPSVGPSTIPKYQHLWISALVELEQILHGFLNKGAHGELTALLLRIYPFR